MAHESSDAELAEVPPSAYRPGGRLARARVWLPVVAVLALIGISLVDYAWRGDERYTPGTLAAAHASWDNDCAACHVDFQPVSDRNWAATLVGQHQAADARCSACHAGPVHHAAANGADVPGCATCHHEHRGREAALTRMPDARCTACHADLDRHYAAARSANQGPVYTSVTAFNAERHPEFGVSLGLKDPGTIAFNHKRHLTRGIPLVTDPKKPFTIADVQAEYREQYRVWADGDGVIQLDCAACHRAGRDRAATSPQTLAELPPNLVQPARPDGALMLPIVYEEHCQACHPLSVRREGADGSLLGAVTVRHRVQPPQLDELLRTHYMEEFLKGRLTANPALLNSPLPGKNPLREDITTARAEIDRRIAADKALLLGPDTCEKCHQSLRQNRARILPADIPQVWYKRARFDHAAHRKSQCIDCHKAAQTSERNTDVLLPRMGGCLECHAPPWQSATAHGGGARFDCVECHRYHNGDHPLEGRGAAAWRPTP